MLVRKIVTCDLFVMSECLSIASLVAASIPWLETCALKKSCPHHPGLVGSDFKKYLPRSICQASRVVEDRWRRGWCGLGGFDVARAHSWVPMNMGMVRIMIVVMVRRVTERVKGPTELL